MIRTKLLAAAAFALVLAAGCGTTNPVFGPSGNTSYELHGTVDQVDLNSRSVYLTNVSGNGSMLSSSGGNSARVFFDSRTPVYFQGRTYSPSQLDRGDQITVQVEDNGRSLQADSMTVVYNSMGSSYPTGPTSEPGRVSSTIRGTVSYVDASRRTIDIDRNGGGTVTVEYDTSTPVYWNGKTYMPSQLERGDEVDVRMSDLGGGRLFAQDVTVLRNANGGRNEGGTASATSTIRGTERRVDTARRTITLDSASWVAGFDPGAGNRSTITIEYDANSNVDVQGRLYPVSGLQPGDVIDVQVDNFGSSNPFARTITLVRDVNGRY